MNIIKYLSITTNKSTDEITNILNNLNNIIIHKILENKDSLNKSDLILDTEIPLLSNIIISEDLNITIKPSDEFISKIKYYVDNEISPIVEDAIHKLSDNIKAKYYNGDLLNNEFNQ